MQNRSLIVESVANWQEGALTMDDPVVGGGCNSNCNCNTGGSGGSGGSPVPVLSA